MPKPTPGKIDHKYTDNIICPWCGHKNSDSWESDDNGEEECGECEQSYTYERIVTVEYSTSKVKPKASDPIQ